MFISHRRRSGRDRFLRVKAWLLVVGAILLVIGAQSQWRWLMAVGMAALVVAFVLRFLPRVEPNGETDEEMPPSSE